MVEHQPSKLDTWVRFPSPAYARVAQGWSTTLPRLGSRVRIPSRAFFISTISGNTKTKRTCHLRPVRFLFTMKCSMYGTLLEVSMNDLNILSSSPLFHQMMPEEISSILSCLSYRYAACEKNEFVCRHGDVLSFVGLVLSGEVHIIKEDFWGNRTILGKAEAGQLFAESYACAGRPLEVSVIASRDSEILFLDVRNLLHSCSQSCPFHQRLIQNFVTILSRKNLMLTKKIEHMSRRSLRDKLLSYLSDESIRQRSTSFDLPFNRQQLADYLCVDRSALSRELSLLQEE